MLSFNADDTNIFYKHEFFDVMCNILRVELDKVSTWIALNKLALNISKTNSMIFSNRKLNRKSLENNISINGVNLKKVCSKNSLVLRLIIRSLGKIALLIFEINYLKVQQ